MNEVPAGPGLDALIAEHIMGYHRVPGPKYDCFGPIKNPGDILLPRHMSWDRAQDYFYVKMRGPIPLTHLVTSYSTVLEKGWMILEEMRKRGYAFAINETAPGQGIYVVGFGNKTAKYAYGRGRSVEEAICRAALNAINPAILQSTVVP